MYISKQNAEAINLTLPKDSKRLGLIYGNGFKCEFQTKTGAIIDILCSQIDSIATESFLKNSPISEGDLLIGIGDYRLDDNESEGIIWRHLDGKTVISGSNLPFTDGQIVEVTYGVKKKSATRTQRKQRETNGYFEEKTAKVPFFFIYEVEESVSSRVEINKTFGLDTRVKQNFFNQDQAVDKVFRSIKINATGLKEVNKPIGAYLLTGPTGTGKTEMAKLIAKEMGYKFIRVDMSEFTEKQSASRLMGAPPSYIGFGDETILETQIGDQGTKAVLLLDEVEKSHPDVQKLFLQAMDNARITLSNDKIIDFSNTLILMTSNCGVVQKNNAGINTVEQALSVDQSVLRTNFLPEFLGRLSGVIEFNPLTMQACSLILGKILADFNESQIGQSGITINLTDRAKEYLLINGFDVTYGARPLKNFFKDTVLNKLADKIMENMIKGIESKGQILTVDIRSGEVSLIETEVTKQEPKLKMVKKWITNSDIK